MANSFQCHLAVAALLGFATQGVHAAFTEISSSYGCFPFRISGTGAPLSATGRCRGTGATGTAVADLRIGDLGVLAATNGFGNAEARAVYRTDVSFQPDQVVPLTVTMHLTGIISGGLAPSNQFLFQAAVHNYLDFGIVGSDSPSGFLIKANGQSGVGSFADAIVSATGTMLRDNLDITLSYTHVWNVGASGLTIPIGGYIDAQVVPAVAGTAMSADFLHTGSVLFSVPPGTKFTSEGFLQATPVPEPSTLLLLVAGLAGTIVRRRRSVEVSSHFAGGKGG